MEKEQRKRESIRTKKTELRIKMRKTLADDVHRMDKEQRQKTDE